jgi:hypothetical protein
LSTAAAALFLDPGLRKTSITLAALSFLLKKGLISKILIVAPLRVCYSVWPAERDKWKDFNHLKMVVLHGKDKDQLLESDADIFVINPEGLDWLLDVKKERLPSGKLKVFVDLKRWKKLGFDTLVIDELSKFKHTTSSRFKSHEAGDPHLWSSLGSHWFAGLEWAAEPLRPVLHAGPRQNTWAHTSATTAPSTLCPPTTASTGPCVRVPMKRSMSG